MESDLKKTEGIFASPISILKGIGTTREKLFRRLGIFTIKDLIHYYPRDYEDRSRLVKIRDLQDEETAAFIGIVTSRLNELHYGNKRYLTIQKLEISDDTSKASVIWFNQSYLKKIFKVGEKYFFYGRVKRTKNTIEIQNPVYEKIWNDIRENNLKHYTNYTNYANQNQNQYINQDQYVGAKQYIKLDIDQEQLKKVSKIMPVYSTTSGLTQTVIRNAVEESLKLVNGYLCDSLPASIRGKHKLADYSYSIENIHFPCNKEALMNARKRLAFEELFLLQLGLICFKKTFNEGGKGINFSKSELTQKLISSLPYKLTNAQLRVFDEISRDMQSGRIMNRLVQGDVGSGKTVIAVLGLVKAVENGYQGALMVPTGILAEQHYQSITNMLKGFDIRVGLLTGNVKGKEKTKILQQIRNGDVDIIIGTHALIQDAVEYHNIGLVITDEQHRFGVRQRLLLSQKGENPHILVMTATPIPRTLA
ncbi:MAG: DEAD/DEAH box helicase, partial [Clostridiaceae bacterium]|nr:DEAD/DEAH box helicase [Clostridiaceae bacterium]